MIDLLESNGRLENKKLGPRVEIIGVMTAFYYVFSLCCIGISSWSLGGGMGREIHVFSPCVDCILLFIISPPVLENLAVNYTSIHIPPSETNFLASII